MALKHATTVALFPTCAYAPHVHLYVCSPRAPTTFGSPLSQRALREQFACDRNLKTLVNPGAKKKIAMIRVHRMLLEDSPQTHIYADVREQPHLRLTCMLRHELTTYIQNIKQNV